MIFIISLSAFTPLSQNVNAAPPDGNLDSSSQVLICHMPPDNPDAPQNIEVGEKALNIH